MVSFDLISTHIASTGLDITSHKTKSFRGTQLYQGRSRALGLIYLDSFMDSSMVGRSCHVIDVGTAIEKQPGFNGIGSKLPPSWVIVAG